MATLAFQWGTNNENILLLEYGLRDVITDREPREGNEWSRSPGGAEDAWRVGEDFTLQATVQFVPVSGDIAIRSTIKQWQDFKSYVSDKQTFRFVPDASVPDFFLDGCFWDQPMTGLGSNRTPSERDISFKIRHPTQDFLQMLRGIMFEYAPDVSLTNPVAATFARATAATRRGLPGTLVSPVGAIDASGVLRDRHYEGMLRTTLLESGRTQLVTNPENFAAWTVEGTPVLTSGQADPMGGTAAYLLDDDSAVAFERIKQNVAFTGDGTKAMALFIRQGSTTQNFVSLFDTTVGSKIVISITWTAGVPALGINSGSGTVYPPESYGNGWYRISWSVNSVVATNTNQFYINSTFGNSTGETGTLYIFGANAWNAAFPSSYQGPSLTTRNIDDFSWPYLYKPQALFCYVDFVERGSFQYVSTNTGYVSVGDASNAGFFLMPNAVTDYTFIHRRGSDMSSSINLTPAIADRIQLLGLLSGTGTAQIKGSKNGAAEIVGSVSGASALANAWFDQKLFVGRRFSGDVQGFAAFARVKIGPLSFGGVTRDTIAKALSA